MAGIKRLLPGGIRDKLIAIFVLIKVLPLLLLAWFAWHSARSLGEGVASGAGAMADNMLATVGAVGDSATQDSIRALDLRSREALEAMTTEVARQIATFLYERDADIIAAASIETSRTAFEGFLHHRRRDLHRHGAFRLSDDQTHWVPEHSVHREAQVSRRVSADNARNFHARAPEYLGERRREPLFLEMTFIGLDGRERIKVTTDDVMQRALRNVADPSQTFVKAETYWASLQKLKPGEIYVSDVIGAYVPSVVIGPFTPAAAAKAGIAFEPEKSAYAGTENPVGKPFRGIVRWATPVVQGKEVVGYVTLALNHDHIRQFSDRLMPTEARYTPIADAINGNYAFIWDHKSRSISHPRDFFIVGYDPDTGRPATPWMDSALYEEWQRSGLPSDMFLAGIEAFRGQRLDRKPARELVEAGTVALDCRYLNFSPQCEGWKALTEHGGSGSFAIFFSGLWKLTTAAAIPYYTGQYGESRQGFGFVTIGANVNDFHRAATESGQRIAQIIDAKGREFEQQRTGMVASISNGLSATAWGLAGSTAAMVVIVIVIAVLMANFLTTRITHMISGIRRFESGDMGFRLEASDDEMGDLARSFNVMADSVADSFKRLDEARLRAEEANRAKSAFLAGVSHELRTPLNGILGFAELLEVEADSPEHATYARTIHESGKHLVAVVNDLLDLSKIEAGRMELNRTEFALLALLEEVVNLHRGEAQRKGLMFDFELASDLPEKIIGDPVRLRQILSNLLNNAVKFTDAGKVGLSVVCDSGWLIFDAHDTGCGIPEDSREKVFEKFQQIEGFSTRIHGGSGLGLALAKQFAVLMGGRIELESAPGVGSSFRLHLPVAAHAEAFMANHGFYR